MNLVLSYSLLSIGASTENSSMQNKNGFFRFETQKHRLGIAQMTACISYLIVYLFSSFSKQVLSWFIFIEKSLKDNETKKIDLNNQDAIRKVLR